MLNKLVLQTPIFVVAPLLVALLKCIDVAHRLEPAKAATIIIALIALLATVLAESKRYSPKSISLTAVVVSLTLILLVIPSLFWAELVVKSTASRATMAFALTGLLIAWGALSTSWIISRISKTKRKHTNDLWVQIEIDTGRSFRRATTLVCVGLITVLAITYYFSLASNAPILRMLAGDLDVTRQDRTDALAALAMPQVARYGLYWARAAFLPLILGVLLVHALQRRRLINIWAFIIATSTALVFVAANTEKSPVVKLLLVILLTAAIVRKMKIRIVPFAILGGITVLAFPLLVYTITAQSADSTNPIAQAYDNLINRIFIVPARVAMIHFEVFPDQVSYLKGASIRGLNFVAGKEHFPLANYLYVNAAPPELNFAPNPLGNANAAFPSEMWANFGWLGVIFASLVVGVGLQVIESWLKSRRKTPLMVSMYSTLVMAVTSLLSVNFTTVVLSGGLLVCVLIVLVANSEASVTESPEQPGGYPSIVRSALSSSTRSLPFTKG